MEKEVSSIPSELRELSNEDELLPSSIFPRQVNLSSLPLSDQSSKLWVGPAQTHSWTSLPECMRFIAENGCTENQSLVWVKNTLNGISLTATPEQLIHILDGYADLYKISFHFIQATDNVLIKDGDTQMFCGTLSDDEQHTRHRNIAFIMYDPDKSSFAPLYVTHRDGNPQTCFAADDERITDHIADLIRKINHEISQRSASEIDHNSDNNDATINVEESQPTDILDPLLPAQSTFQNDVDLTTSEICENDIQHASQTITRSNGHSNHKELIPDSMTNDLNSSSSTDLVEELHQQLRNMTECLDQARCLHQEVRDVSSMETDDRQLSATEGLKEQKLISKNIRINSKQREIPRPKTPVSPSNDNLSQIPLRLSQTIARPDVQAETTNISGQEYDAPRVTRQPKDHRRVRMLNDLRNKCCPCVQAGEGNVQRAYPEIEVPSDDGLYIRVRVVTENKHSHPFQCVAPQNARVDRPLNQDSSERDCLKCDPDSFDRNNECVYLPITEKERQKRGKPIQVHLFNWKQYNPTIKEVIERENLRLCRLEYILCKRSNTDAYELVSPPSYTSVIKQSDGDVTIESSEVKPRQLCELGGEIITVPLSSQCRKKDFHIECNGDMLENKNFTMKGRALSITSPPKVVGTDELHLIISREEYDQDSPERQVKQLYEDFIPYVHHGQCSHTCSSCN